MVDLPDQENRTKILQVVSLFILPEFVVVGSIPGECFVFFLFFFFVFFFFVFYSQFVYCFFFCFKWFVVFFNHT